MIQKSVNILVNNAGVLLNEKAVSKNGLEATFATNTLGTYCMTEAMLPFLSKANDARVVNVSSGSLILSW